MKLEDTAGNHLRGPALISGPAVLALCILMLPRSLFPDIASRSSVGCMGWMIFWWVLKPVDYSVTALLPVALNALIPMAKMSGVLSCYASETILLLFCASIISTALEETGLSRRLAVVVLHRVGDSFRLQLVFWFLLAFVLSAVLPNSVVCATLTPIAVYMLGFAGEGRIGQSSKGAMLLLYIAFAAGVGGLATPLGGAMNLVAVDYLQKLDSKEYLYMVWVFKFLPVMICLTVSHILFMVRGLHKGETLGRSKEYFEREYRALPPASKEEKWAGTLFLTAAGLSFARPLYQDILPGARPAFVFLVCAICCFLVSGADGKALLGWQQAQSRIIWELLFIFAGGLAAGTLLDESGACASIGDAFAAAGINGGAGMIFLILLFTMGMSCVTSNTAAAAVTIPVILKAVQGAGMDPEPYIYIACIGINLSYILPTSIRAVPVGYGLPVRFMMKEGWKLTLLMLLLMTGLGWILIRIGWF